MALAFQSFSTARAAPPTAPPIAPPIAPKDQPSAQPSPSSKPRKVSKKDFTDFNLPKELTIPKKPNAPVSIPTPAAPKSAVSCERKFKYNGKLLNTDSYCERDGEGLRPVVRDVPQAIAQLDAYQKGRSQLNYPAYVGSTGLVLAFLFYTFLHTDDKVVQRNHMLISAGLVTGGLIWGVALKSRNESRLDASIRSYNEAHPGTPIQMEAPQSGGTF